MTYPDLYVATLINEYFIPVQVNVDQAANLVTKYRVIWTPNINVLDEKEFLIYHNEGFLPPSEYSAMLLTARGHYFVRGKHYSEAIPMFQEVWDKFPRSTFASEAMYYLGVSRYMETHKVEELVGLWKQLQVHDPYSSWAIRSSIV